MELQGRFVVKDVVVVLFSADCEHWNVSFLFDE